MYVCAFATRDFNDLTYVPRIGGHARFYRFNWSAPQPCGGGRLTLLLLIHSAADKDRFVGAIAVPACVVRRLTGVFTFQEVQILKALVLGEEERGQFQYQVMCFLLHADKTEFISADAMAKLRQVSFELYIARSRVAFMFMRMHHELCISTRDTRAFEERDVFHIQGAFTKIVSLYRFAWAACVVYKTEFSQSDRFERLPCPGLVDVASMTKSDLRISFSHKRKCKNFHRSPGDTAWASSARMTDSMRAIRTYCIFSCKTHNPGLRVKSVTCSFFTTNAWSIGKLHDEYVRTYLHLRTYPSDSIFYLFARSLILRPIQRILSLLLRFILAVDFDWCQSWASSSLCSSFLSLRLD